MLSNRGSKMTHQRNLKHIVHTITLSSLCTCLYRLNRIFSLCASCLYLAHPAVFVPEIDTVHEYVHTCAFQLCYSCLGDLLYSSHEHHLTILPIPLDAHIEPEAGRGVRVVHPVSKHWL